MSSVDVAHKVDELCSQWEHFKHVNFFQQNKRGDYYV